MKFDDSLPKIIAKSVTMCSDVGIQLNAMEFELQKQLMSEDVSPDNDSVSSLRSHERQRTIHRMVEIIYPDPEKIRLDFIITRLKNVEAYTFKRTSFKAIYYGILAKHIYNGRTLTNDELKKCIEQVCGRIDSTGM